MDERDWTAEQHCNAEKHDCLGIEVTKLEILISAISIIPIDFGFLDEQQWRTIALEQLCWFYEAHCEGWCSLI